jgi:hypothetical protein
MGIVVGRMDDNEVIFERILDEEEFAIANVCSGRPDLGLYGPHPVVTFAMWSESSRPLFPKPTPTARADP